MESTYACVTLTIDVHNELEKENAFGWFMHIHHISHNYNLKLFAVGLLH